VARAPVHLTLVVVAVLWSIPTIALLVSSFREPSAIAVSGWWNALTQLSAFTTDNYQAVLAQRGMARAFLNSLIITAPSTALTILVAAVAAYAFAWMPFRGSQYLFLSIVALMVVPIQMTLVPLLRLYSALPIDVPMPLLGGRLFGTSSFLGVWLAHCAFGLPFAVFLLRNAFASIPRDLLESASLDGASDLQIFRRIILPLSAPSLAALAIFQFLWVWNDLLVSFVFLSDPNLAPMTLRITNLVSSFGSQYQLLTAAAFVSMVLPLIIFFGLQRYFVQGILAGSVKG
jgi:alpha-glucoside transport system permease protein